MNESVLVERDGAVATLTMNRPAALNALNAELNRGLIEATAELEVDPSVRCVVLRGAGGNFMAGGDIKVFGGWEGWSPEARRAAAQDFVHHMHPLVIRLRRMPKPVLASVEGAAAGFGLSLVLACDLAVAAEDSFFTMAYSALGTSPDGSSTYTLPRAVGLKRAMELAMLAERFDANTALGYGILNRVVATEALEAETAKLAARLAAGPTLALANTKALLNQSLQSGFDEQLQAELERFGECTASEDFMEGVRAFIAKRKPEFKGR